MIDGQNGGYPYCLAALKVSGDTLKARFSWGNQQEATCKQPATLNAQKPLDFSKETRRLGKFNVASRIPKLIGWKDVVVLSAECIFRHMVNLWCFPLSRAP